MDLQDPLKPTIPPAAKPAVAPPAKPEIDDGFESTLMADEAPSPRAGSPLYQDDKKFPRWVWPVGIVLVLVLWWLFR